MNHPISDPSVNKNVLIVESASGTFSKYTAEILKAEGLNFFQTKPLDDLGSDILAGFWVVILNETALEDHQAQTIRDYVSQGGCLIAFRPDPKLSDVFGITPAHEEISEGYLRIDTDTQIGVGLVAETIQYHGAADAYQLNGADPIAHLYRSSDEPTQYPAVVCHTCEKGRAVAFTYNLPQSIVYTRQGNPAWAGQERDGILGIRAAEMYLGWNDPTRNHLNQSDEHMRLLSNSIEYLSSETSPLPRLWYFPGFHRCLVILTDDGEDSSEEDFETHLIDIESAGGHLTLYLKGTYIPAKTVARWTSRGHEIGSHFDDTAEAEHPTYAGMSAVAHNSVKDHLEAYHLSPISIRNHWIVWVGWSEQAEIEANCGIRMDCNTYHYDLGSPSGHYLGKPGSFTGSGLPMKFASRDGAILDIYQSITQLPDEQWLEAALLASFKTLIDRSLDEEAYSFINVNFHTDRWQPWSRKPGMEMLDYANRRSVPLWNAANTIDFLTARDAASFVNLSWMEGDLSFDLYTPNPNQSLTFMLPQTFAKQVLFRVTINGAAQSWLERTIKGRPVVLVPVDGSGPFHITGSYR